MLYLIVLNMELHYYVNVCHKILKRQNKHASMPVRIRVQPQEKTDGNIGRTQRHHIQDQAC